MDNKEKIIKALAACNEFCCDECPYQHLDHKEFKLRCIHTLISDMHELFKEGRLTIFSVEDIYPCRNCDTGWGSISSEGCHSCKEDCVRLKEYNDKYNTK